MVEYEHFLASDGEQLAFQTHGQPHDAILILIHGFTGSSQYFTRNFHDLSQKFYVVAPDLRGHGMSTKARHGYHVARLAADLRDLLAHLKTTQPKASFIGIGCSLGASILWTYSELFDSKNFAGMVFVDQGPLQDYIPGSWTFEQGNYGVHDAASLAAAQATLHYAPGEFYRGLVQGCLAYRFKPKPESMVIADEQRESDENFFVSISRQGDPWWFAKLLANHTSYDHRDTIQSLIKCPCLVMAGERSGSFPVVGILETARLIGSQSASTLVMDSGHCKLHGRGRRVHAVG
jgi:pimeloyl-ACP methyl ester carboxylesterase